MRRAPQIQLSFAAWPEEDRNRWNAAFKAGDPFDDCGPGAHPQSGIPLPANLNWDAVGEEFTQGFLKAVEQLLNSSKLTGAADQYFGHTGRSTAGPSH